MQKSIEQADEWQAIWKRQGLLDRFIDTGRTVYNLFLGRVLRSYLTKDSTMLEIGCGRASLSISLAPGIKKLVGTDISDVAIQQARQSALAHGVTNAQFVLDDCTNSTLTEKFDFIWSQGLLEHFEDPHVVAKAHYDALAPGGAALLSMPYRYSYHTLWYKLTRPSFMRGFWPWTEQVFFTRKELLAIGRSVTPNTRVFFLQPFPLGLILLEMKKPLA